MLLQYLLNIQQQKLDHSDSTRAHLYQMQKAYNSLQLLTKYAHHKDQHTQLSIVSGGIQKLTI